MKMRWYVLRSLLTAAPFGLAGHLISYGIVRHEYHVVWFAAAIASCVLGSTWITYWIDHGPKGRQE